MNRKIDGYDRYRAIVEAIVKECEGREPNDRGYGFGDNSEWEEIKHYIMLENGLHVYTKGSVTYLSDRELQMLKDEMRDKKQEQLFLRLDYMEFTCKYYPGEKCPIEHKSHGILKYDIDTYNSPFLSHLNNMRYQKMDIAFIPDSLIDPKIFNGTKHIQFQVPPDMEEAILEHRGEHIQPDAREVYNRIMALNTILMTYERQHVETEEQATRQEDGSTSDRNKELRSEIIALQKSILDLEQKLDILRRNIFELRDEIQSLDMSNMGEVQEFGVKMQSAATTVTQLEAEIAKQKRIIQGLKKELCGGKDEAKEFWIEED